LFYWKPLLRNLILPPVLPLIIAIAGALMLRSGRRFGGAVLAAGLGSLWLFSMPVIGDALTHLAERYPPLDLSKQTQAAAVVILGGNAAHPFAPEFGGPRAAGALLDRLSYGAFVAKRTGLPILVSGTPIESRVMQASLTRDFGIAPRWVEGRSHDTYENAAFSRQILRGIKINRIILVTSGTHLWRAAQEFQNAGFDVVPAPASVWIARDLDVIRFVPDPTALQYSYTAMYELIAEPVRRVLEAAHTRG